MNDKVFRILEFDRIIEKLKDRASSTLGKELAEKLVPSTDYEEIKRTLRETTDAVTCILRKGSPPLGGIHDIRPYIQRAEAGGMLYPGELLKIADVLRVSRNLKNYVSQDKMELEETNTVYVLCSGLGTDRTLEERLNQAIENEEELSDYASPALAAIRRDIRRMQDAVKDKLNSIIRSAQNRKIMQDAVVTLRGDRYVIPVKAEYRSQFPGLVHDVSQSGATIFVEPMAVVELNNEIRQLKIKEEREVERILTELTGEVAKISEMLKANVKLLALIDFVFAKARLSLDLKGTEPVLNKERRIVIKKGRHPLIDPAVVVPVDISLGEDFTTMVITGPNTGGKTVTLKTMGLFVLMTQAGLHIPAAENSEMCVFTKVFADIGDEQSIEQSLSTFSAHMTNIVGILREVDENSLVLFDELGAGTDPTEGAALAKAILDRLTKRGIRTMATTHYSELKIYAMTTPGVRNACCEFDVETLRPTYRLLIGIPGRSNAFAISLRLGLDEGIIEEAKRFMRGEDIQFEELLSDIQKNRLETEKERERAYRELKEIERLRQAAEEQRKKTEDEKESILNQARKEARAILANARRQAEEIMERLKELEKAYQQRNIDREMMELRQNLRKTMNELDAQMAETILPRRGDGKPPENLKPGDTVMIINLNQRGTVLEAPDKDGNVLIQAGIMKVKMHITQLKPVDEQQEVMSTIQNTRVRSVKSKSISLELDIRGLTTEEARERIDKYIDDAIIAGLHEVSIIHGKGTGALRKSVHDFLSRHPHVETFRLGKYGEGETGVTIVKLKE
ncbi:MutS2 protein MutS [Thermoclostridium stercorarium subsp. stercorarium DSM 8532]|jgi:DNA mismatch repair protein MutS2|uniref:Endonuclease MutS2 n=3 Tax=Thermoclostridium stercorarium TaxID=1510 RepID=L7VM26_THES1|nr:endonuclease MutS2 [Thermoclostridium stercorarium]AGC67797.1 MutS2 protein MutS [Thermoclostridium stercorarium subsp. stercorarium DSM 8532]AGI38841.1 MutS [Thermoclostridium stercorarium subsp. stercorarium DSM 8532]ANW98200.1 recombination and DNA strand exchange inhibitor protein [Thermoclostridium stercorarium subsp. thermolacticum DSM 2910]ANX00741.1 recombination and DNA strand exchange inhibitor protein [Thermoclostridium stercorarium subsp. leptospartum DSM 9219]